MSLICVIYVVSYACSRILDAIIFQLICYDLLFVRIYLYASWPHQSIFIPASCSFELNCVVCVFHFVLQINERELAFISLLAYENDFRSLCSVFSNSSLPSLLLCAYNFHCKLKLLVISDDCLPHFRIPESLPHLHDKVLAAAADAAINLSPSPKKEEVVL